jgi:hypothetical protein
LAGVLLIASRTAISALFGGDARASVGRLRQNLSIEDYLWVTVIVGIFLVLAIIGWLYAPSNGDSLVYHLARVEHWIQNRSVAPFAAHYLAQVELSPLAEFNMAHVQLLSGYDRLDGYVQLTAAIICAVGVTEIARLLGGSRRVQVMAAVICATIPAGILEATSTQNNYFAASIGVALLLLLLTWSPQKGLGVTDAALGAAIGLAVLAKGTLPSLFAPVVVLLLGVAAHKARRELGARTVGRQLARTATICTATFLVLAGPFLGQNIELFGSPFGPISKSTISVDLTAPAVAANVVRSTADNFMIGNGKSGIDTEVSKIMLGTLRHLYSFLGVAPADSRYAMGTNFGAFTVSDYSQSDRSEDSSADPWNVFLIIASIAALSLGVIRGAKELRTPLMVAAGLGLGYILFTGTARWSVFVVRYEVPLLVVWSALIALALGRLAPTIGRIVLAALVVASLPQLLNNVTRSVLHPSYHSSPYLSRYLVSLSGSIRPDVYNLESLTGTIAASSCHRVGLANWVLIEYPIWAGLHHDRWPGDIQDVDVHNQSSGLEQRDFNPCALIRQESSGYVAADDGNVHLEFGTYALAIEPDRPSPVGTSYPGFSSTISGVSILPGGGWTSTSDGPVLVSHGSVYLSSPHARRVQVQIRESSGQPRPLVTAPSGSKPLFAFPSPGMITLDLSVGEGATRIGLAPDSLTGGARVQFVNVSVAAANG